MTSMGRFQNIPIAVGDGSIGNNMVEELVNGVWRRLADFPFAVENIYGFSMVTFKGALYLFGKFPI